MTLALFIVCVAAAWLSVAAATAAGRTFVYVANAGDGTISVFSQERESGVLERVAETEVGCAASPLAVSPHRRFLYASLRGSPFSVATFAINPESGTLKFLGKATVPASLTYMAPDRTGRFLLGASYSGGMVCVLPLAGDGPVRETDAMVLHPGRNPHCILTDASNSFAFAPLLGDDRVAQFLFEANSGFLRPNLPAAVVTRPQSGPRHLAFSPDNRFAYLLTELSGEAITYAVDAERGTLTELHSVSILPPGSALPPGTYEPPLNSGGGGNSPFPVTWGAEIRVAPDGRFVYASERTDSSIVCFRVDAGNGKLTFMSSIVTERQPRAFAITPSGRYLVAAGEKSRAVAVYRLDSATGWLSQIGRNDVGDKPGWVEIVEIPACRSAGTA